MTSSSDTDTTIELELETETEELETEEPERRTHPRAVRAVGVRASGRIVLGTLWAAASWGLHATSCAGLVWIGAPKIARRSGETEQTTRRALAQLVKVGFIVPLRSMGPDQARRLGPVLRARGQHPHREWVTVPLACACRAPTAMRCSCRVLVPIGLDCAPACDVRETQAAKAANIAAWALNMHDPISAVTGSRVPDQAPDQVPDPLPPYQGGQGHPIIADRVTLSAMTPQRVRAAPETKKGIKVAATAGAVASGSEPNPNPALDADSDLDQPEATEAGIDGIDGIDLDQLDLELAATPTPNPKARAERHAANMGSVLDLAIAMGPGREEQTEAEEPEATREEQPEREELADQQRREAWAQAERERAAVQGARDGRLDPATRGQDRPEQLETEEPEEQLETEEPEATRGPPIGKRKRKAPRRVAPRRVAPRKGETEAEQARALFTLHDQLRKDALANHGRPRTELAREGSKSKATAIKRIAACVREHGADRCRAALELRGAEWMADQSKLIHSNPRTPWRPDNMAHTLNLVDVGPVQAGPSPRAAALSPPSNTPEAALSPPSNTPGHALEVAPAIAGALDLVKPEHRARWRRLATRPRFRESLIEAVDALGLHPLQVGAAMSFHDAESEEAGVHADMPAADTMFYAKHRDWLRMATGLEIPGGTDSGKRRGQFAMDGALRSVGRVNGPGKNRTPAPQRHEILGLPSPAELANERRDRAQAQRELVHEQAIAWESGASDTEAERERFARLTPEQRHDEADALLDLLADPLTRATKARDAATELLPVEIMKVSITDDQLESWLVVAESRRWRRRAQAGIAAGILTPTVFAAVLVRWFDSMAAGVAAVPTQERFFEDTTRRSWLTRVTEDAQRELNLANDDSEIPF